MHHFLLLPHPRNPLSPAVPLSFSETPQQATEGQVLGSIDRGGNGRHLQNAGGKQGQVHLGAQSPLSLVKESWATFPYKRRASRPLALVPSSPLCSSCCLFKDLPLPLSLLPSSLSQPLLWLRAAWGVATAGPVSWCLVGAIISPPLPRPTQAGDLPSPSPSPLRGQGAGHELSIMPHAASVPGSGDCGSSERRESSADR